MHKSNILYNYASDTVDLALEADRGGDYDLSKSFMQDAEEINKAAEHVQWYESAQYDNRTRARYDAQMARGRQVQQLRNDGLITQTEHQAMLDAQIPAHALNEGAIDALEEELNEGDRGREEIYWENEADDDNPDSHSLICVCESCIQVYPERSYLLDEEN